MIVEKELKLIAQAAREFALKKLAPEREENDKYPFGPFFKHVVESAFELDFFHILLPQKFNGLYLGMTTLSKVLENICMEESSLAAIIFTTVAAHELMLQAGSMAELKQITANQSVRKFLLAMPVYNNPAQVKHLAQAHKNGDKYLLSGKIAYLVLGDQTEHALIPAQISDASEFSYFLVNLSDKGVFLSDPILSLGLHACPAVDIELTEVKGALLGDEGSGERYFNKMADRMHVAVAAMALGIMKGTFKEALDYAKNREQGGHKIIQWSEIKMMLAEIAVKISAAEMILAQAAHLADTQAAKWQTCTRSAALHIQAMACDVTTDGIQVMGGVGYMKDFGQEKRFRDARHIQSLLGIAPLKKIALIEQML